MRRRSIAITVLTTTMAVSLVGCALLEQLSPSADWVPPGGHVDLPESGIALTFRTIFPAGRTTFFIPDSSFRVLSCYPTSP